LEGNLLAENISDPMNLGGQGSSFSTSGYQYSESFIDFIFPSAGTYVIKVAEYPYLAV
jgi:hypothetical protein